MAAVGAREFRDSENTGFPLVVPKEIPATLVPTGEDVRLLQEEIDPKGIYLG